LRQLYTGGVDKVKQCSLQPRVRQFGGEVSTTCGSGWSDDCWLSLGDFGLRIAMRPIGNRQSQIDNPKTHPLPQVVLTS